MADFAIVITPSGGDWFTNASDIALTSGVSNLALLAMMGGNIESSTPGIRPPSGVKRDDYWGNAFLQGNPEQQFNSEYERTITTSVINTANVIIINNAAERDLKHLEELNILVVESVSTALIGEDKVETIIGIREPDNTEVSEFSFIWDATKKELLFEEVA